MNYTYAIAALAAITAVGVAAALYASYYAVKYGPDALTPLEAWLFARSQRDVLDRELAELIGTP